MSLKRPATALAAGAVCCVLGSVSIMAQESCGDLYNRVTRTYQTLGPQSPRYAQLDRYYDARCLSGSSGMPSMPHAYQTQDTYQQPAPVDPGAAFIGVVVGGAADGDHRLRFGDGRWR